MKLKLILIACLCHLCISHVEAAAPQKPSSPQQGSASLIFGKVKADFSQLEADIRKMLYLLGSAMMNQNQQPPQNNPKPPVPKNQPPKTPHLKFPTNGPNPNVGNNNPSMNQNPQQNQGNMNRNMPMGNNMSNMGFNPYGMNAGNPFSVYP